MMHIDTTMEIVTLEALEVNEADGVLAILATAATADAPDEVQRRDETSHEWHVIPRVAGATAPGGVALRERHLYEAGEYRVVSSTRDRKQRREFFFRIDDMGKHAVKIQIMPGSAKATWIMGNYDPVKIDGALTTIHIDNGRIASIEAGEGQSQRRLTAWEQLDSDAL